METRIYKNIAKILGIVLIIVGMAAFGLGIFVNGFIEDQLRPQGISFPDEAGIQAQVETGRVSEESGERLMKYAGQQLLTGDQAKVFADDYIGQHMDATARGLGYEDANYSSLSGPENELKDALKSSIEKDHPELTDANDVNRRLNYEMLNPESSYEEASELYKVNSLRYDTMLDGSNLRGILLMSYGAGLAGKGAKLVGVLFLVVGLGLGAYGFYRQKD